MLGSHRTASQTYETVTFLFSPTEAGRDAGHTARQIDVRLYRASADTPEIRAVRNTWGPYYHVAPIPVEPGMLPSWTVTRPVDHAVIGYLTGGKRDA